MSSFKAFYVTLVTLALASCANSNLPMAPAIAPPGSAQSTNYVIGPGDTLNVFVWHNADLTRQIPVRPDGKISMPLMGDVQAAGKTPDDLSKEMQEKLQQEIAQLKVEATAGGGMITVTMDGQKNLLSCKIDPEVAGDVEMLQDMLVAACNEATKKVDGEIQQKMGGMLGGMGLPPGMF